MIVGLTGGIASGKTLVADRFAARGVTVLDTDVIARDVVAPGSPGLGQIRDAFGDRMLAEDGTLDRGRLRKQVFADPGARRRLESITHPLIRQELERRAAAAGGAYQVHVIPLLVEAGLRNQVDRVLLVDCPEMLQISRLRVRDGETRASARRILAAQASRDERRYVADDILLNTGDRSVLTDAVDALDQVYRRLSATGEYDSPGLRLP
ncbi:MAG: dephospho-CoA kinase [Gammaproteobacteria bacterium]